MSNRIKLSYQEKTIELGFVPVSPAVITKIRGIEATYQAIINDEISKVFTASLKEKGDDAIMSDDLKTIVSFDEAMYLGIAMQQGPAVGSAIGNEIKQVIEKISKRAGEMHKINEKLAICQALLDSSKLNEENSDLVNSDITSEFWQNQTLDEVQKAIDYFRRARV